MSDFATALRSRLTGDAEVAGYVGTRIYPTIVAQNAAFPYIRYQTVSDPRPEHLSGYQSARVSRVQIDCFAKKYIDARAIAEAVIEAVAAPGETDGVHFGRVKAEGPRDLGEDTSSGFVHRASLDLLVEHKLA
jgi:hypothetical protein